MPLRTDKDLEPWGRLNANNLDALRGFVTYLNRPGRPFCQRGEVLAAFEAWKAAADRPISSNSTAALAEFLDHVLEVIPQEDGAVFVLRSAIGRTSAAILQGSFGASGGFRPLEDEALLAVYEGVFTKPGSKTGRNPLRLDFLGLYDEESRTGSVEDIGRGLERVVQRTTERLRQSGEQREKTFLALLAAPARRGRRLLIDPERFVASGSLAASLRAALTLLRRLPADTPTREFSGPLRELGLEPGWGSSAAVARRTLAQLAELLETPTAEKLSEFLPRLPLVERVVVVSPHGWFGQENVLGRPDTGGQIVYILDQVQGLERTLKSRLETAGLETAPRVVVLTRQIPESEGTTCGERREPIRGTAGGAILRLPFLSEDGQVVPRWMSRFEVWPYLQGFAEHASRELPEMLGGEPDLIIGNYSDGNLVAALLAERFGCALCTIAHALEKTKYPLADLRWTQYEDQYHFSIQLLADLAAMNAADFVVASTFQEIAGDDRSLGQYEAHRSFALPGLYRVSGGTDPFLDKFNIVPPGVNEEIFFPYTDTLRRDPTRRVFLERLLFEATGKEIHGALRDPAKTPLLTLARLDRTKNITGLVERFGASARLREHCNLLVIAGKTDAAGAADAEERAEIELMYDLIARHGLEGHLRWLGIHLSKQDTGELYRVVADHGGVFVQPALYEAFGLTVLEAMASGLPTFATRHGGPAEIIQDGVNGYLIDPKSEDGFSGPLLRFLDETDRHPDAWKRLSEAGIGRVRERFTWSRYSRHLLDSAVLYGLRRVDWGRAERRRIDAYIHLLLRLFLVPRAEMITRTSRPAEG